MFGRINDRKIIIYTEKGDAEFVDDLATTPNHFFDLVFKRLDSLKEIRYPRNIFVVHGRDDKQRETLVSILKKLNFKPIVLQAQPNRSLTIIEKLEQSVTDIGFVFVIYTGDDMGHLLGEHAKPRVRQNVVFEHGLLW